MKAARRCKPPDRRATLPPGALKRAANPSCGVEIAVLDLFRAFQQHDGLLNFGTKQAMLATRPATAFSLLALFGLLLGLAAPVLAQDLSAADRSAIRDAIQGQVDAFRRDDGEGAFGKTLDAPVSNVFRSAGAPAVPTQSRLGCAPLRRTPRRGVRPRARSSTG